MESVETLIEAGLQDHLTEADEILFQRDCVMELWNVACSDDGESRDLAIWGLGEIAKDRTDGIGSLAHDRLDRLAKELPEQSKGKKLARSTLRSVLSF